MEDPEGDLIPLTHLQPRHGSPPPGGEQVGAAAVAVEAPSITIDTLVKSFIPWYDHSMKTAISIPDDVFESADELAEKMGVTRSHLYATAVAEYVAKHRASDITATLNEVYSEEPSGIGRALRTAQARSVGSSGW